jgi:hypothetical protein
MSRSSECGRSFRAASRARRSPTPGYSKTWAAVPLVLGAFLQPLMFLPLSVRPKIEQQLAYKRVHWLAVRGFISRVGVAGGDRAVALSGS